MNAAAAASGEKFDLNSYSQMYQMGGNGATSVNSGLVSSNPAAAAAAAATNDYYSIYNQQHGI